MPETSVIFLVCGTGIVLALCYIRNAIGFMGNNITLYIYKKHSWKASNQTPLKRNPLKWNLTSSSSSGEKKRAMYFRIATIQMKKKGNKGAAYVSFMPNRISKQSNCTPVYRNIFRTGTCREKRDINFWELTESKENPLATMEIKYKYCI